MTDVTISLRIDKQIYNHMKLHDEINWSSAIRKSIRESIEKLERIDFQRAKQSAKVMDTIRKSRAFDKGRSSTKIIREWRQRRR